MANTISFNDIQPSHVLFFIIKLIEYIFLWAIVGLHLFSLFTTDALPWMLLEIGTEVGYIIIISVLLCSELFIIRMDRNIHGIFNFVGFILFLTSGIRLVCIFKNNNVQVIQGLASIYPGFRYEDIENGITRGTVRGSLNIVEGVILLIDSILSFKKIV